MANRSEPPPWMETIEAYGWTPSASGRRASDVTDNGCPRAIQPIDVDNVVDPGEVHLYETNDGTWRVLVENEDGDTIDWERLCETVPVSKQAGCFRAPRRSPHQSIRLFHSRNVPWWEVWADYESPPEHLRC